MSLAACWSPSAPRLDPPTARHVAAVLERLAGPTGAPTDGASARAAIYAAACEARPDASAWHLLAAAGARLGLRLAEVRWSARRAAAEASPDAPLVALATASGPSGIPARLLVLLEGRGGHARVLAPATGARGQVGDAADDAAPDGASPDEPGDLAEERLPVDALAWRLGAADADQPVRWAVLEPGPAHRAWVGAAAVRPPKPAPAAPSPSAHAGGGAAATAAAVGTAGRSSAGPPSWLARAGLAGAGEAHPTGGDVRAHPHGAHGADAPPPLTPVQHMLRMLRAEARDLRAIVLLSAAVGLLALATPVAVDALVSTVAFGGLLQPIIVLVIALTACLGLSAGLELLKAYLVELTERRLLVRTACALADRLPRVRAEAFDPHHPPELVHRYFDLVTVQKTLRKLLLDGVAAALSAGIGLIVLAFYHPLLLAFDIALLGAIAVIAVALGHDGLRTSILESKAKYRLAGWLAELARAPDAFRAGEGLAAGFERADQLAALYLAKRGAHWRIAARQLGAALLLQVAASSVLLGLGGFLVKTGQLTLGQLVASWLIVSLVLAAITKLGGQLESVYDLITACDKIGRVLELPVDDAPGGAAPPPAGAGPWGASGSVGASPGDREGARAGGAAVALEGVTYLYPGTGGPLAGPIDLALPPGGRLAITGRSGAGKSTLCDLLAGKRAPSTGRVALEAPGRDGSGASVALVRPPVGAVAGTVAENLRLARPAASHGEMTAALAAVGLLEVIERLPAGLDTDLVPEGRPLSQGEALRLGLARALLASPDLLVVDGALDGLEPALRDRIAGALLTSPATIVVATTAPDLAERFPSRLTLGGAAERPAGHAATAAPAAPATERTDARAGS